MSIKRDSSGLFQNILKPPMLLISNEMAGIEETGKVWLQTFAISAEKDSPSSVYVREIKSSVAC